uniref:Uncharacterized protein n=1 Tax=Rhizophora mucronata TaxID=61149 RepID=A0A2P2M2G2_RHIMU
MVGKKILNFFFQWHFLKWHALPFLLATAVVIFVPAKRLS